MVRYENNMAEMVASWLGTITANTSLIYKNMATMGSSLFPLYTTIRKFCSKSNCQNWKHYSRNDHLVILYK